MGNSNDETNLTQVSTTISPAKYCISCIICGETVEESESPLPPRPVVCEECKQAVLEMRMRRQEDANKRTI